MARDAGQPLTVLRLQLAGQRRVLIVRVVLGLLIAGLIIVLRVIPLGPCLLRPLPLQCGHALVDRRCAGQPPLDLGVHGGAAAAAVRQQVVVRLLSDICGDAQRGVGAETP